MTDIVERLREGVFGSDETKTDTVIHAHMQVAADEIERLRAALRSIANNTGCVEACPCWAKLRHKAERALKENSHD